MIHRNFITILAAIAILNSIICTPLPADHGQSTNVNHLENLDKTQLDLKEKKAKENVITTIDQVQKMLANDPNLPRLTKGEIEDLFEEVTKEEYEKSIREGNINRANHMRALMLVLPYNTNGNSDQNLQELFNRPPVTKVIQLNEPKPEIPLREVFQPSGKVEIISIGNPKISIEPTTYKPFFRKKVITSSPTPITTYHPGQSFSKTKPYEILSIKNDEPLNDYVVNLPTKLTNFDRIDENENEKQPQRFSSHYNAKNTNFNNKDIYYNDKVPNDKPKSNFNYMTSDLEDVLNNLGFAAKSQSRKRFKLNDYPLVPQISSIIKQDRVSIEEFNPSVNIEDFTKSLLPQTKSRDYVAFKPLNFQSTSQIEPELEHYLIRFGLVDDDRRSSRTQKALKSPPKIEKIVQAIETTKNITQNDDDDDEIKRIDRNIDYNVGNTNVFNPSQADSNDYNELGRLLNNLRELQDLRVNLTDDNLKKLQLTNYNLSESLLGQGPNPIDMPEFGDLQKNEIKRQEINSDNIEPTRFNLDLNLRESDLPAEIKSSTDSDLLITTEFNFNDDIGSITESSTATTTEESSNGSISDLEDSFGKLDPVSEEPLPPPRKNGFYFLADINSFLEVGEGKEKVLVRFNPKIGDPSRFIPVKVP